MNATGIDAAHGTADRTPGRRAFLAQVGGGMLVATLGSGLARRFGASPAASWLEADDPLAFGRFGPWVELLTDTPLEHLQPKVVALLREGVAPADLVGAAALANARAFGGEDYLGYHAYMALVPALEMSRELPAAEAALPLLKVLVRNTARIQGSEHDRAPTLTHAPRPYDGAQAVDARFLVAQVRARELDTAEAAFDTLVTADPSRAFEALLPAVNQEVDVHRVVLAWRAWDILRLTGAEHARVLLRQVLRQCIDRESHIKRRAVCDDLPQVLDATGVLAAPLGTRRMPDAQLDAFARELVASDRRTAATSTAAALVEGFAPDDLGQAHSLATTLLMLRQRGRPDANDSKRPRGSVHGAGTGVHASDTAAAWRGIARAGSEQQTKLALVSGGYYVGGQSGDVGEPLAIAEPASELATGSEAELIATLSEAVERGDQLHAAAAAHAFASSARELRPMLDVLLANCVASDGALHAEKYYRTQTEALTGDRPAFRPLHAAALARVCASQSGIEADGRAQALELLRG